MSALLQPQHHEALTIKLELAKALLSSFVCQRKQFYDSMGEPSRTQYTYSMSLVSSSFKTILLPFIVDVVGIQTKIESGLDMLKSEVLQIVLQILI